MPFHPKYSKLDQIRKVTPLSETTSIPITFIQKSPPELLSASLLSAHLLLWWSACLLPCLAVCLTSFLFVCLSSHVAVTLLKREVCNLVSLRKCVLREAKIWGSCIRRLLEGKTIPCQPRSQGSLLPALRRAGRREPWERAWYLVTFIIRQI